MIKIDKTKHVMLDVMLTHPRINESDAVFNIVVDRGLTDSQVNEIVQDKAKMHITSLFGYESVNEETGEQTPNAESRDVIRETSAEWQWSKEQ